MKRDRTGQVANADSRGVDPAKARGRAAHETTGRASAGPASVNAAATRDVDAAAGTRVHVVGIGGVGVAGLARLYLQQGVRVSGSDRIASPATDKLAADGATIHACHAATNLPDDCSRVVISAAVPEDNPEVVRARERGIPVEKFSEALGRVLDTREGIAIAGTHGKTTVSAWTTDLLRRAGRDVGYLVGGLPIGYEISADLGTDPAMVCEACEFDRSFLSMRPQIAVINNIEEDHLDYYADLDEIYGAFREFVAGIRPGGMLIAPTSVLDRLDLPEDLPVTRLGTGFAPTDRIRAEQLDCVEGTWVFTLWLGARNCGRVRLRIPGEHSVHNALSAAAVGLASGLEPARVIEGLGEFRGVGRRLERVGMYNGAVVLDDYAHHPTEVAATLAAAREAFPGRRLWALFQPHQYSRTRRFLDAFAASFGAADRVVISEIYRAREAIDPEVSGAVLTERIRDHGGEAEFVARVPDVLAYLRDRLEPGDVLLTMGAGDITGVSHGLVG